MVLLEAACPEVVVSLSAGPVRRRRSPLQSRWPRGPDALIRTGSFRSSSALPAADVCQPSQGSFVFWFFASAAGKRLRGVFQLTGVRVWGCASKRAPWLPLPRLGRRAQASGIRFGLAPSCSGRISVGLFERSMVTSEALFFFSYHRQERSDAPERGL